MAAAPPPEAAPEAAAPEAAPEVAPEPAHDAMEDFLRGALGKLKPDEVATIVHNIVTAAQYKLESLIELAQESDVTQIAKFLKEFFGINDINHLTKIAIAAKRLATNS